MKIVVLDGHTMNPGDLSWSALEALGDLEVYARTAPAEVVGRASGAEIVVTNKAILHREQIAALPGLRYIGVSATGYNVVDIAAANERGIVVTNVPEYGTRSVAQHAFALLLELTNQAGTHAAGVRSGAWARSIDWCYWNSPLIELDGLALGIVGYGRIGRATAAIGRTFGMRILTSSRGDAPGAEKRTVEQLFSESDVVSLHCPLTPENSGFVNAGLLARMKPSAFLINTGRGPLINERDLADALNAGKIAGAGLDVLSVEPPPADHPLLTARNCIVTPHQAWGSLAARSRLLNSVVENLKAFLSGNPRNTVKP